MYAIVRTGGKQYKVSEGDIIRVERIDGEIGRIVELRDVLLLSGPDGLRAGNPTIENAFVSAEIIDQGKAKKIVVFKKKRRKGYKKKQGHRQLYTRLRIREIRV